MDTSKGSPIIPEFRAVPNISNHLPLTLNHMKPLTTNQLILIAAITLGLLSSLTSCCCKTPNRVVLDDTYHPIVDSVAYDMYRGINIINHEITPIYIPQKDSVFLATDTIRINKFGVYNSESDIRASVGVFVSVVKFAKED